MDGTHCSISARSSEGDMSRDFIHGPPHGGVNDGKLTIASAHHPALHGDWQVRIYTLRCLLGSCSDRLRTKNMRTRSTRSRPHMTHTPAHTHDITVTRVTTVWSPPWAPHTHNTYAHPQIDSTHMRVNAYRVSEISAIATNPHPGREASQTTPYPTLRTCTYQENQKYQPARRYIDHA